MRRGLTATVLPHTIFAESACVLPDAGGGGLENSIAPDEAIMLMLSDIRKWAAILVG
jgi:hypothetical protein